MATSRVTVIVVPAVSEPMDWKAELRPTFERIRWDSRPLIRHVLRWAARISQGKDDLRQTETPAEFVPGGTMGPVAR